MLKCCTRWWLVGVIFLALPGRGQVMLSEFMADNKHTVADEDQQYPDWIELYNTNTVAVNLSGWSLTDDPTHAQRWTFPQTNLAAKGFLVVFASGKDRAMPGAPLHTDFKLDADGEYLALLRPNGSVASEFAPKFPAQYPDISYGLAQEVSTNTLVAAGATARVWVPQNNSLGTSWTQAGFGDAGWPRGATGLGYETAVEGFAVSNVVASVAVGDLGMAESVLANPAQQLAIYTENAPVINYYNTSGNGNYGNDRTFPGFTMGADRNDFVIEASGVVTIPTAGDWTFGVNSDDGFSLTVDAYYMDYPSPRSAGDSLQTFYFPMAGDYPLRLIYFERGGGSEVELFAAPGSFSWWDADNFRLVGDTLNGGLAVKAPVVSGGGGGSYRSAIATDVQSVMNGINASVYVRLPFGLTNAGAVQSMSLRMKYDDGFVAYLNGQRVASRNAPATPQWNSAATGAHPNGQALVYEDLNVSDRLGALQTGTNVLAIQGLNQSAADTDFLLVPELVEYRAKALTNCFFTTPSPGQLNRSGYVAFVADTKFSIDRGFYDAPTSLVITTATVGATIVYTTNGSPPSLTNGLVYSNAIPIRGTTCVRATAFKAGFLPSNVDTHTYLFPNDIIRQSPTGMAPPGWPTSWGANVVDYGMDPDVVNAAAYSAELAADLKTIPTFSIVTELRHLFDPATGIYANAEQDGIDWERPASIELIYPDGRAGFHINGGVRIRGGYSRSTSNPKHAFRLFFRTAYGAGKLAYPLFARQGGAGSFDCFDLRTSQNYSWSYGGDYRYIGVRDQWSRDTQMAMGQSGERGDFYHLYINGQYWGVYNTCERAEASYGAAYFGGEPEDYDVVKVDTDAGYSTVATDGNLEAWTRLWRAAADGFADDANYYRVQGRDADGSPNPGYEDLLEVDNLIDYMLVIFFTGNIDAPISAFIGNQNPNNFYALRDRTGQHGGFRFVAHDSEHTLLHESTLGDGGGNDELHRDRTGPFAAGDPAQQGDATALGRSNPQYLFTRLTDNAEFRMKLADRIQQHFFNGGALTAEAGRARLLTRSNEIYGAVACESARWGDSKVGTPRTRNVDWVTEMKRVYGDYFNQRPDIVLSQLQAQGWYPSVSAPAFNQFGGIVSNGFQLVLSAPAGTIYYTADGSDPRLGGGAVSASALVYGGPIPLSQSARIRARVFDGSTWSAVGDATFFIRQTFTDLLVSEVMYHPPATSGFTNADDLEFIELKNVSAATLELSGVHFTDGIDYSFPLGSFLAPGQFVVLAADAAAFASKYPGVRVDGVYRGKLSNQGERLTLAHVTGTNIFSVSYGTRAPWPAAADGIGMSLVSANPNYNPDPDNPGNWRASSAIGGSPGQDDAAVNIAPIVINEVLTHTDLPQLDAVELFNPTATNVDIGNWYLTDQRTEPKKYRFPAPTMIPAKGYKVVTDSEWGADALGTNAFRLDSHGEQIYLYSADGNGALTGYSDGLAFGAAQNGVSFGRYVISTGEAQYPAQRLTTLGWPNAGPRVGPIVINEIHYHPTPEGDEFVELKSLTNVPVKLYDPLFPTNTWRLQGVGYEFPTNTEMPAGGLLLVAGIDPGIFRAKYSVPANVPIYGPYTGRLQGGGEALALQCPDHPDLDTNTGALFIPYYDIDVVRYQDQAPWPVEADGLGASLERLEAAAYGNDPINWRASPGGPTPGVENTGNRFPVVNAGPDRSLAVSNAPIAVTLAGAGRDDGQPNPPGRLAFAWSQVSGPGRVWFSDPAQTNATVYCPGIGQYVLRLTAEDGALQGRDEVTIDIQRAASMTPVTLITKGSVWRYLDNGTNLGTGWVSRTYNDTNLPWRSGRAPLGYGDANGQWPATTNSYGPNSNDRYVTTYYRRHFSVSGAASLTNLVVSVQRDDGVVLYLNGTGIYTNNMPAGTAIGYRTYASGTASGADEATFYSQAVNPRLLVEGDNVVASEIHQVNATSSDIIFDLQLAAERPPANQGPLVNAGTEQTIDWPASAQLSGDVRDDGLPLPPGLLSSTWSKFSGPGAVTFADASAPRTTASFSVAGTYVLRLTVSDGALAAAGDLTIRAVAQAPGPFPIEWVGLSGELAPQLRFRFSTKAGHSYTVQYRNSLGPEEWLSLTNLPVPMEDGEVEVRDALGPGTAQRYYRVVTSQP